MNYLTLEEILRLHFEIINDYGGSHGVRDESRLQSVVAASALVVFEQEQYKTVYQKAAVYLRNIIADHPFVDGNKRTATTCMGIFLMRQGHKLTATPKELEDIAVQVAVDHLPVQDIAAWLKSHTKP